jgi:DNA-binding NtrC family response regulator
MMEKQAAILIVDDEEAIRKLLERKLSSQGYLCQTASNADLTINGEKVTGKGACWCEHHKMA